MLYFFKTYKSSASMPSSMLVFEDGAELLLKAALLLFL
jgi:hypothetical protein